MREIISGRERVREAFAHREADRAPVFDVVNNPAIYQKFLGKDNHWSEGRPVVELARLLGLDAAMVPVGSYTALISRQAEWLAEDRFRDRFGVVYRVMDSSWPLGSAMEEVPLDSSLADRFSSLAKITEEDLRPIDDAIACAHSGGAEEIALFAGTRSAFSQLYVTGGIARLSMLIYDDPDTLRRLVSASTEYWTEVGLRLIEAGADALYVANDMGMNGSTLISPEHLREFFLPELAKQCATWKKAGGTVILHSCGNVEAILPDLAAMGFDGLNNLQARAGMDIASVKKRYGDRWTLVGNVDATGVMTSEDPAEIEAAVRHVFEVAGSGGGLIMATDHSFHKGIPLKNVLWFIECAKRAGSYHSSCFVGAGARAR